MKRGYHLYYYLCLVLITGIYSCHKKDNIFEPQGGLLPTHYVSIKDGSFSPASLTVANGSSITFLNGTTASHTLISDDSTTLHSILIAPDSSYFFKPDTATTIPVLIYIPYHCIEHPTVRGTIILTQ